MKKDYRAKEFRLMVAIGESTTAGGSATARGKCWVSRLGSLINEHQIKPMKVVNSGIGANVISERSPCYPFSRKPAGLERLRKHVLCHKPDLVIVSYGLNDMRGGTPLKEFCEDLETMIGKIKSQTGALVVLVNVYFMTAYKLYKNWTRGNPDKTGKWNAAIEKVAKKKGVLYADIFSAEGSVSWMVDKDGVHANNLGHRVIANKIFETLASNCSCLSKKAFKEAEKAVPWRDETVLQKDYGY